MKRVLAALLTAIPLAVGVASAQAAPTGFPGFPGGPTTGTGTTEEAVVGTVVSNDPTDGTFVANAYLLTPPSIGTGGSTGGTGFPGFSFPGFGTGGKGGTGGTIGTGGAGGFGAFIKTSAKDSVTPTATEVTIYTDSSTSIHVIGGGTGTGMIGSAGAGAGAGKVTTGTVSELVKGAKFIALFPGSSSDTLQTLVTSTNPATAVDAQVPEQFYAFVGTVSATSTSTTPETVTVDVTRSLPSSLITGGTSSTFTVGPHTFIVGGSSLSSGGGLGGLFGGLFGGSLSNVSTGDLVAGGLIGDAGLTLDQVEASPLMFLLDLPAPASTGTSTSSASSTALKETMKVLHGGKLKLTSKKSHKRSHGKSKKSHTRGK